MPERWKIISGELFLRVQNSSLYELINLESARRAKKAVYIARAILAAKVSRDKQARSNIN